MAEFIEDDKPLPQFRKDLEVFEGPSESDGSPTFNIYDPIKVKYFKITWAESIIFKNLTPGMTLNQLNEFINNHTTLSVTKDDLKFFFLDALRQDLLNVPRPSEYYQKIYEERKQGVFKWLLLNYLYIKIPLVNPDAFLSRTLPFVKFLGSKLSLIIFAIISLIGISLLFTRFGEFVNTFTYFFNVEGFLLYATSISMIKFIHEFAHAYTAKNFGLYVPSMGVALIVLWPVLFTDVTDSWKLKSRKQRICISIAGITAELIIAGLCTIGWYYSEPGIMHSIFFVVASITWISTLIVNLNPAIRFDGYYILMDLWGFDNLQQRAFSVTRWKFREWFFGLKTPPPEERLSRKNMIGMVVYSIYTFIYRIFLYTAIAVFIYHKFTKALGIFLFLLEIGVFLIWPLLSEIHAMSKFKDQLRANPRLFLTVFAFFVLMAWFILPLPHTLTYPAITVPIDQQIIYVTEPSMVKKINVERDQDVKKGDLLITLGSPPINHEIAKLDFQRQIIEKEISLINYLDTDDKSYLPEKKAELASNNERLKALKNKKDEFDIYADFDGKLFLWDDKIREGIFIPRNSTLGKIADPNLIEVICYIPETDIDKILLNEEVKFRLLNTNELFEGTIININPAREINLKHMQLASVFQGELAVNQDYKTNELRLIDTYYTIQVKLKDPHKKLFFGQIGRIEMTGPWESILFNILRNILRIFWRESGV